MPINFFPFKKRFFAQPFSLSQFHLDPLLLSCLLLLAATGLTILYSSSSKNLRTFEFQTLHLIISFIILFIVAQIPILSLQRAAPWFYVFSLLLLIAVLIAGHIGKGAQRWLHLGFIRFQPAELMKLAIPLFLAWYYQRIHLPITLKSALIGLPLILIPAFLTAKQPDLGTAILLTVAGLSVLFLVGLSRQIMLFASLFLLLCIPFAWYKLHDYQQQRVLTFLNPERDPLGTGYHIIQSKIAIGSGGLFGKGWLNGTQSNLNFLPEHSTDFIFAVCAEEFGLVGSLTLLALYFVIILRCFYIAMHAQDTFSRLLAGSLTLTFFVSFFTNISMVTGILPIVGIPLPLVSYGGSSLVTIMASFGMLMSIQTHRKLVTA